MVEELSPAKSETRVRYGESGKPRLITDVDSTVVPRRNTGIGELDRVLGGGIVPGALILIGGDMLVRKDGNFYDKTVHFLAKLPGICPVYCANGNHEQKLKELPDKYEQSYEEYKKASNGLKEAFKTKKPQFDEYSDEWGSHRSYFVPMTTKGGKEYVVGIDVSLQSIDEALNTILLDAILVGLIVNIITVLVGYFLFKPFVKRIGAFTSKIEKSSLNKDLTETFESRGDSELSLMNRAIGSLFKSFKGAIYAARNSISGEIGRAHV